MNSFTIEEAREALKNAFPYSNLNYWALGGKESGIYYGSISLDKREDWANWIFENSRFCHFHIENDKTEVFARGMKSAHFRKSKTPSVEKLIEKFKEWEAKSPLYANTTEYEPKN